MAKRMTLGEIRDLVRARGEWRSEYISDSDLADFINDSAYRFYVMVATADPLRYIRTTVLSVVSGTIEYDLPSDFWRAHAAAMANTAGDGYHQLDRFEWDERWQATASPTRSSIRWTIRGGTDEPSRDGYYALVIQPEPDFSGNLLVDYIPDFEELDSSSDTFDVLTGAGLEWVVLDTCIMCAAKEESDPSVFIAQKQEAQQALMAAAPLTTPRRSVPTSVSNSLEALRRAVRSRGPWPREAFTDTDLTEWLNSSAAALVDIVIQADPSHFLSRAYPAVVSGTSEYDLPSDFYKLVQVAIEDSADSDGYAVIESFRWEEYDDSSLRDATESDDIRWAVRGDSLYLRPKPSFSGGLRLDYIALPAAMSDPSDTLPISENSWQEFVILDACVRAALAHGSDPAPWKQQRDEMAARISASAEREMEEQKTSSVSNTVKGLVRSVRTRGNWTREAFSDAQMTEWANSSQAALVDLVIGRDPTYFLESSYKPVVSGTRAYALPSDFYRMVQVSAGRVGDGYDIIESFRWEEYDSTFQSGTDASQWRWHIRGSQIHLQPSPATSGHLRLDYIPLPDAASWSSDLPFTENTWQEWIILDMCCKAALAAGGDQAPWAAEREKAEQRILTAIDRSIEQQKTSSVSDTILGLIRSVRTRGGWPREMFSDTQIIEWVNSSHAAFADLIFEYDPSQFLERSDISVVSGTREYDLPSDFYRLLGVALEDSSYPDGYVVLEKYNWKERYDYEYVSDERFTRYLVQGDKVQFHPTPTWSGTIRLEYFPIPDALVAGSSLTFERNSWQEWIILDCCVKAAMAAGTDGSGFASQRAAVEARIMRASPRDSGRPKTMVDTSGKYRSRWLRRPWPWS